MKLNNLPLILSLTCAFALSANAADSSAKKAVHHKSHKHHHHHEMSEHHEEAKPMMKENKDYNFATLKGGLVNPTPLGGNSGLNVGNDTYTVGLSVGRKFEDRFAVELEYMFRGKNTARAYNVKATPGDSNTHWAASSNTFMANVSADLIEGSKITPYLKSGIGASMNKSYDYVVSETDNEDVTTTQTYTGKKKTSFAWQVGAGVNMKTTEMFDTQLQYMFIDRGLMETKANYTQSSDGSSVSSSQRTGRLREHVITVGITTKF